MTRSSIYNKIKQLITHGFQVPRGTPPTFLDGKPKLSEAAKLSEDIQANADLSSVKSKIRFESNYGEISSDDLRKQHETVVVLHLYYLDLWEEIDKYLPNLEGNFDFFISIPKELESFKSTIFAKYPDAYIYFSENRGRDSAPFLIIFRAIYSLNYKYLLKIHSKKSTYREGGDIWRRGMLDKLLGSKNFVDIVKSSLDKNGEIGLIAPLGYTLNSSLYWGMNQEMTRNLGSKIGIVIDDYPGFGFVAGSMYWARPSALENLTHLPLNIDDFELEPIPVDGTLAHTIERLIGVIVAHSGYSIREIDEQGNEVSSERTIHNEFFGLQ
jgi:lipopolysaccharide biosynthesis protein